MESDNKKYYKKAFTEILLQPLKEHGFTRYKNSHIARISNNEILQLINFQKSAYGEGLFTVNISVRPLYIQHEHLILEPGGRLGEFLFGTDKWWQYRSEKETQNSFYEVKDAIEKKVLPWYEQNNSSENIVKYQEKVSSPKIRFSFRKHFHEPIWKPDDFGYVALRVKNYTLAKKNFIQEVNELKKTKEIEWCKQKIELLHGFIQLIEKNLFQEIDNILNENLKSSLMNLKL